MLLVQRGLWGDLLACVECRVVNAQGQLDPFGEYVWVEQFECNPHLDTRQVIRRFLEEGARLAPTAKWGYWIRRDHPRRKLKCYARNQLVTFARRDADVAVAV